MDPVETSALLSPDLAEAASYATASEGFEHGLVVLAMGLPYWLEYYDDRYRLLIERPHLAMVAEQLKIFDRESVGWPPVFTSPSEAGPTRRAGFFTPLFWALSVLAIFCVQQKHPGNLEAAGALDSQKLFLQGEWWRPFTALFLHADASHLAANWVAGIFVFSTVIGIFGLARAWICLAIASVAGNVASAAIHFPEAYRSIGASTAIFAGLGLLTGRAVRTSLRARTAVHRWRRIFVPLAAGSTLLGLFGAGGLNTDIGAHATGFLAGVITGFAAAPPSVISSVSPQRSSD